VGQVALELVEVPHVHQQLADDEERPPVAEDLRGAGDRTVLPVEMHGAP
jgi:hypothetical protein